jgi:hypothetical protein
MELYQNLVPPSRLNSLYLRAKTLSKFCGGFHSAGNSAALGLPAELCHWAVLAPIPPRADRPH